MSFLALEGFLTFTEVELEFCKGVRFGFGYIEFAGIWDCPVEVSCTQMEIWHWSLWERWELQMFYHCQHQGDGGNCQTSWILWLRGVGESGRDGWLAVISCIITKKKQHNLKKSQTWRSDDDLMLKQ